MTGERQRYRRQLSFAVCTEEWTGENAKPIPENLALKSNFPKTTYLTNIKLALAILLAFPD